MIQSEILSFICDEIRKQLNIILGGSSANASRYTEDIESMLPGMPTITSRPIMRPWGYASRAPRGTVQVTGRQGDHFGNRIVLGHRAADIPADLALGETVLYDSTGKAIRIKEGKIRLGSSASAENLVLGKVLQAMLQEVLTAIASHTHVTTAPGAPTTPPNNAATFSGKASSPVGDGGILSDVAFTQKG